VERATQAPVRMAVVGAGSFGRHHLRVIGQNARARLVAVVDIDRPHAEEAAARCGCQAVTDWRDLAGMVDAAVVAVPTSAHAEVGCGLIEAGIDVLVEKPLAADLASARRLVETARARGRTLQVGHLERFNPAVIALRTITRLPLFFEVHRLSEFTPRSLDVDVVLDLMIHDIDILLALTGDLPEEIRAAGLSILSPKVDIANVRLAFPGGCVANLTASRISTERVRKLRMFQPHEYISLDYGRQDAVRYRVSRDRRVEFGPLEIARAEPLQLQLEAFLDSVVHRRTAGVSGEEALRALEVAFGIMECIEEHARRIAPALDR